MKLFCEKLNILRNGFIFFIFLLGCTEVAFAAGQEMSARVGGIAGMSMIYGILAGISLMLLIGYGALVKKKEMWLLLLFVSIFLVNAGYFSLSISKTLGEALLANRIAYLGSVFLPFFMLMTIAGVCHHPCKRWGVGLLIGINVIVFLIAASPGYTGWYYKEVTLIFVDGAAKLKKVYGPLHNIYFVFLFSYFAMMVGLIIRATKKKWLQSPKQAILLLVVVLLNILFWLVEQMISWDFEFLSVSYIISELLLLCLYSMLQDIEEMQKQIQPVIAAAEPVKAEQKSLDDIVEHWSATADLSPREKDVFRELLTDKKRKDIAEALCVSENTVKTHTSRVFSKMEVSTRSELIEKVFR